MNGSDAREIVETDLEEYVVLNDTKYSKLGLVRKVAKANLPGIGSAALTIKWEGQNNGLRSGCFTGLPRHSEPPECGSCWALAIGVRRLLPHVSRDAGRGRGITQSNRRGTRRGKGYFSPPNQWLALPKSERTCSSPDKKRI